MAERRQPKQAGDGDQEFTFKNIQLLKNESLGTGSYGAVFKAKCDQLMCAAKLLWPALFSVQAPDPGKEYRQPFRRFEQECQFLRRINHPNIVQYLGTYHDPETNALVLLMELMDESLTHYLETSPGDIPYHIQVKLVADIAQALAFLHANGIIHRDLSSNNVLLIAGSRAKVSDFGMLTFTHLSTTSMTTCPGTPAFMSPEALNEPPVYTEKLDNFSFGVLLVQTVTKQFPKPSDRFKVRTLVEPGFPHQTIQAQVAIPEVERRQAHISLIEPTHPLLPIALDCLKDRDVERPSSQQLCQSVDALKRSARYEESSKRDIGQLLTAKQEQLDAQIRAKDEQIRANEQHLQANREQIRAKDEKLLTEYAENRKLSEQLEKVTQDSQVLQHNNQFLQSEGEARGRELRRLNQQLVSNKEITASLQQTIAQRDREVSELRGMLTSKNEDIQGLPHQVADQQATRRSTKENCINIVWESLPAAPDETLAGSATVIEDKAYFRPNSSQTIHEFNSHNNHWSSLPTHPLNGCTIVNIDSVLTTIGGRSGFNRSSKLYSYIKRKWVEHFPPMPTKRSTLAAVYANNTLVVAGGHDGKDSLTTVETLNTRSKQWYSVSSLPFPANQPSTAICGDKIYLHTSYGSSEREQYSVLTCSLRVLVQSKPSSTLWEGTTSLSVRFSSLATINGHLLAVGGLDHKNKDTKTIQHYNPITNSWHAVSQMSVARCDCLTVSLPGNKLMVVGGYGANTKIEMGIMK